MYRLIEKLHLDHYLNSRLILVVDTLMSLTASMFALLFANTIFTFHAFSGTIIMWWLVCSLVFVVFFFLLFKTHKIIIRHSTLKDLYRLSLAIFCKELAHFGFFILILSVPFSLRLLGLFLVDTLLAFAFLVGLRVSMVVVYNYFRTSGVRRKNHKKILIYDVGDKSVALVTRLQNSPHYTIEGFLSYGIQQGEHVLLECPIYYFTDSIEISKLREEKEIDAVLFATERDARKEQERLVKYCVDCGMAVLLVPSIDEVVDGKLMQQSIRAVKIEDLLGREEIKISLDVIKDRFKAKSILVTGAAGSIGSELCRQLARLGVQKLILFDNAETPMHNLRLELEERFPQLQFVPVIGDVRMQSRLDFVFRTYSPQVVFHAAAYKHVPLMQENPCEAVLVNVIGSRNVADKCIAYNVEKMVMISTDKAVNPTSIMGCTKRLAEIYVQSLGLAITNGKIEGKTHFVTTRFGNVLGSNGSVIPRFREQIAKGGPVTVTHPDVTRFLMTIPEACRLVMEAATISVNNEILVFDMGESVKISHLAQRMIELAGLVINKDIQIVYTGLRPGEKLYEELLADSETTLPTSHDSIRIAKVREYGYSDVNLMVSQLEKLSEKVDIQAVIRLILENIPENRVELKSSL